MDNFEALQNSIQQNLNDSLTRINSDFKKVTTLYLITFYLGLALILFSIIYLVINPNTTLISSIFGGIGFLDIISFVLFKPIEGIQRSRALLAKILTAYICSINQMHNLNYAFNKIVNIDIDKIDFEKLKLISDSMITDIISLLNSSAFNMKEENTNLKLEK